MRSTPFPDTDTISIPHPPSPRIPRLFSSRFPPLVQGTPQIFALLIGIDQFESDQFRVRTKSTASTGDAKAFHRFFRDHLSVPEHNIEILANQAATRSAIITALRDLRADERIRPGDAIFISFSGLAIDELKSEHIPVGSIWETEELVADIKVPGILPYDSSWPKKISPIPYCALGGLVESIAEVKGNNIVGHSPGCSRTYIY